MEIRKLNSLRGLAALIVLIGHYSNESGVWGNSLGGASGHLGVMIFFLLSAFLMSYKYLDTPPTRQAVANYAIARVARVMPLFFIVVLLSFTVHQYWPHALNVFVYDIPDLNTLASHLLLLHGTSVLWTIPPEMHFYMLFAIAWVLRPRLQRLLRRVATVQQQRTLLGIVAMGAILLTLFIILRKGDGSTITVFGLVVVPSLKVFPYFAVGALMGLLFLKWQPPARLCSHYFVLTLLVSPFLYPAIFQYITDQQHGMWADVRILVCVSAVFFILIFLVPEKNRFLENWAGDMLGKISYSLYILHFPLLLLLKDLGLAHGISGLVVFLSLVSALAYVSFYVLELPIRQRLKSVFSHRISKVDPRG